MEKTQYLTRRADERCYRVVDRAQVAHLLRAARSRNKTIHVVCGSYHIGSLTIVVQQPYHQRLIAQ